MSGRVCSHCGEPVTAEAAFCEACGRPLDGTGAVAGVRVEPAGDEVLDRDHYVLRPAPWVAGVCDRGIEHTGNEDAIALAAQQQPDSHAVLVVCDGVTTAANSDVASLAAATAALAVLAPPLSRGVAGATSAHTAAGRIFERAVHAAQDAVLAASAHDPGPPGACTFVAAVVSGPLVWHAAVGDSRAYLFPDEGPPLLLTRDDSMAEMLIETGMARDRAERTPVAHTITRWLGVEASDLDPHLGSTPVLGASWLLVCSDGLWNYASAPQELQEVFRTVHRAVGDDPVELAEGLVRFANEQGGHDNISAAVARIGVTDSVRPADDPLA
jgi:serine/threonine protein phosphatase PrpC